jgi:four helix bundle protein
MKINRFEDIVSWQKAQDLAVDIYGIFASSKDYGFKDQITRASVSISNNIAEGFDRNSDNDFVRFLNYARTSCNEVKSMSYLAFRLGYINEEQRDDFLTKTEDISRLIWGLINYLTKK